MNPRSSNATALRRLMTEYKQLTSQGVPQFLAWLWHTHPYARHLYAILPSAGAPDGMFTAGSVRLDNQ